MKDQELGISVLKSAWNSEAKNLTMDWAELGLDSFFDSGLLKDAPMLGTVARICAASKTIRDTLFLRKVCAFLRNCPEFTDEQRAGFLNKYLGDPMESKRLSDAIVLLLDKLDDLEKAPMLAKVFAALVRERIDYADFRRLAAGIDIAFVGDLQTLAARPPSPHLNDERFLALLEPAGFVSTRGGVSRHHAVGTRTDVNTLGKLFQQCIWEE